MDEANVGQSPPEVNPNHITPESKFDYTAGPPLMLFDATGYRVIAVTLKGEPRTRLAQKCEGHSPAIRGCPTGWHIVPKFLEIPLLHALLAEVLEHPSDQAGKPDELIVAELRRRYREKESVPK